MGQGRERKKYPKEIRLDEEGGEREDREFTLPQGGAWL